MILRQLLYGSRLSRKILSVFLTSLFVLLLLYLLTGIHTPTTKNTYNTDIGTARSEYYDVLNRRFFKFLARTNMECHIIVEPGEKWSNEAIVTTKLLEGHFEYTDDDVEDDSKNEQPTQIATTPRKYILVYRHFEQLGKTVENLLQLAALAKRWGRSVVKPNVTNSRFSMDPDSHSYPMGMYFDMEIFERRLEEAGYAQLVGLESFLQDCHYSDSRQIKTTLVHFLYNDYYMGNTKLWYQLNDMSFKEILSSTLASGWTKCDFINKHLGLSTIFKGIHVGRQLCVNPEVVRSELVLEKNVLNGEKCVIFVEWRGLGKTRTHFSVKYSPFFSPRKIKHRLSASDRITREVTAFKKSNLPSQYISVHLRTERMFARHTFQKFNLCVDHIVHVVGILRELRGIPTVFLATDMTEFGTDAYDNHNFYTTNATGNYRIGHKTLTNLHMNLVKRLHAITYKPLHAPFFNDKGIVSLVEMNILKGGLDLVTLESGTFHIWLLSEFREHQKQHGRRGYTITEICPDGSK